jgi:hypothetical protein
MHPRHRHILSLFFASSVPGGRRFFFSSRFSRSAFREILFSFSKLLLVAVVKGGQRLGSRKRRIGRECLQNGEGTLIDRLQELSEGCGGGGGGGFFFW